MPVTYCDRAYEEVMSWTANTKISYAPNRKSGKSFHRYAKYMKAKTVAEALKLGTYGLDLLFDFEKGLLKSTGGPKRECPPDVSKHNKEELKTMCKTDLLLGKMYVKWKTWKKTFAIMDEHGVTRKDLKVMNDAQEGGTDSIVVTIGRREAQRKAIEIMKAAKAEGNRAITDDEVLSCLRLWGFKENTNRGNVMPEGQTFVHSDTVGLIKMSTCEKTLLTTGTKRYPEFTQLLTKWQKDNESPDFKHPFCYTSINVNKNYAGRLHRDGNNAGPSIIKAFGEFSGGELNYWPGDDKKLPLDDFKDSDKVTVDLKNQVMLFDGNRGHCVNYFEGKERYSLVFFSVRTWHKVPEKEVNGAIKCGIPVPTKASMTYAQTLLTPTAKGGYRVWPGKAKPVEAAKKGVKRSSSPAPQMEAKRQRLLTVATPSRAKRSQVTEA